MYICPGGFNGKIILVEPCRGTLGSTATRDTYPAEVSTPVSSLEALFSLRSTVRIITPNTV